MSHTRKHILNVLTIVILTSMILGAAGCSAPQTLGETPAAQAPTVPGAADDADAAGQTPAAAPSVTPAAFTQDQDTPLAPRVIAQIPAGGEELSADGSVEIVFDQPMQQEKTAAAFRFLTAAGDAIDGETRWSAPDTLTFRAARPLDKNTPYRIEIAASAVGQNGATLEEPYTALLATAGDLLVSRVIPANAALDVENDTAVTVIFNRPVVPLVTATESADLPSPLRIDPPVKGKGEWINTSVYVFRPDEPLRNLTVYKATVKAGLQDASGNALPSDYSWVFTTVSPSIAEFGVIDRAYNPEDNFEGIPLDQRFSLAFRQPMDRAGVEKALAITAENGASIPLKTSWQEPETILFEPAEELTIATKYSISLPAEVKTADGAPLESDFLWHFSTYPLPGVMSTTPANNTTQKSYSNWLQILFKSPMRLDSLKGRIVVEPALVKEDDWSYESWNNSVNIYSLQPSTKYTVRILPGAQDIYGNTIEKEALVRFGTGAISPFANLQMPYTMAIYRSAEKPPTVYVRSANVRQMELSLYRLTKDTNYALVLRGDYRDFTSEQGDLLASWKIAPDGAFNERISTPTELRGADGELLPPGYYFLALSSPELKTEKQFIDTRPFIIADVNLTMKNNYAIHQDVNEPKGAGDGQTLIWMTDLTTGAPVAGSRVSVYDGYMQRIGGGVTAADGTLVVEAPVPAAPPDSDELWYSAQRIAMTDEGDPHFAFACNDWGAGVSPYDFGIWSDYYNPPEAYRAYVYTERPIYRPGQPVYFKGIVRRDEDLQYSLPDLQTVRVRIDSYDRNVYDETLSLNEFGSFSGEFRLDREAALGGYFINVSLPRAQDAPVEEQGASLGSVSFNVAEYHKPEFSVDVNASKEDVLQGGAFDIGIAARYYSGGAAAQADVRWALSTRRYEFSPPQDFEQYSFRDDENDSSPYPEPDANVEIIAEGEGKTDSAGALALDFEADLTKYTSSQVFTFESTLTDLSGNQVSGRTSLNVHRSLFYPGIRMRTSVAEAGKPAAVDLVVLDWDGRPVAGQEIDVEMAERKWSSVQEQHPDGSIEWISSVEDVPLRMMSGIKTGADGTASLEMTAPQGGIYRITVSAEDEQGNPARAAAYLWVPGEDYIPWRQDNKRSFDLVADKKEYAPGETARLLIASPFEGETHALVTLERGAVRSHKVITLKTNSTLYELPIRMDMAPNVYVSVLIVKGALQGGGDEGAPDFRMGMRELRVNPAEKQLDVAVVAEPAEAGPGDEVTYSVKVTDHAGEPVQAEVSLALSDLATLSLVEPNTTPIFDFFYASRHLSVTTTVPIVFSMEGYNINIAQQITDGRSGGGGGGSSKGGADTLGVAEVREDFPDTAFWEGHLTTAADGSARVTVTLPDNLTIWRMDARAVAKDTRVGQTSTDMRSTKPLLVRPQTPRFFVAGDKATLGAAVHNNTDEDMQVRVALDAQGFRLSSPATATLDIPARRQAYVSWQGSVDPDVQGVDLVFQAKSGDFEDASRPTGGAASFGKMRSSLIPVLRYTVMETVGTSGILSAGDAPSDETVARSEALRLPRVTDVADLRGSLKVQLAPSLVSAVLPGLDALRDYPYDCLEQTASRYLANILTRRLLDASGLQDAALEKELSASDALLLQRLGRGQNADGGWGWWSGDPNSDLQTSAYVVYALLTAKENGAEVDGDLLQRGRDYLVQNLKPVDNLDSRRALDLQALVLYALSLTERPAVSDTVQLYEVRQSLSHFGRAFLTLALARIDGGDSRLDTLQADFASSAILSATGAHWEEAQREPFAWNTDTRTTALVLLAMETVDPQNEINANAVRWLMNARTQGGAWRTTQESYWSSLAALLWASNSGDFAPEYRYTAAVNGLQLGGNAWFSVQPPQTVADIKTLEPNTLSLDVRDLKADGLNRLTMARRGGAGALYYSAHLDVSLPADQVPAASRGIAISRAYYAAGDNREPVRSAAFGETLLARLTIVAPNDLHYAIIEDALPAGLEAVDQSLLTSARSTAPETPHAGRAEDDLLRRGWGWEYFQHVEMRDEKVVLSASYLPAGTYTYTYLVRAGTSGTFQVIPPTAQEFYFPEVYGRGAGSTFTVAERQE